MNTVYLMRHSKVFKNFDDKFNADSLELQNEKWVLSSEGEKLAFKDAY